MSVTPEQIAAVVDAFPFGRAHALKRGRNPRWPYVPVIMHPRTNVPGDERQEQIRGKAFETRDAAARYAQRVINWRRADFAAKLANPRMRALREQWGLPREI